MNAPQPRPPLNNMPWTPPPKLISEYAPLGLGIRNPITDIYGHIKWKLFFQTVLSANFSAAQRGKDGTRKSGSKKKFPGSDLNSKYF